MDKRIIIDLRENHELKLAKIFHNCEFISIWMRDAFKLISLYMYCVWTEVHKESATEIERFGGE